MPELPEVETIKNDLRSLVIGRRITGVHVPDVEVARHIDVPRFITGLSGTEITEVDRRAKYLLVRLSTGKTLAVQLMITGQLLLVDANEPLKNATRLILDLDDGRQLRLVDRSWMARFYLLDQNELTIQLPLNELGPEPLSEEFTLEEFAAMFRGRRRKIKPLLLDQRFLSGLGNIYTDEVLFAAGVHPEKLASSLTEEEVERLYYAIRDILGRAIEKRGTTVASYRDVLGQKGNYQEELKVFRKAGKPCPRCEAPIQKTIVGGKETFFCPVDQR